MASYYKKLISQLEACEKYQKLDGRLDRFERIYSKLKGDYYKGLDPKDRVKVENIAAYTYQAVPVIQFNLPKATVIAKTPKFITEDEQSVDNTKNAIYMEGALEQEAKEIGVKNEVRAMIQDSICPYEFGVVKVGHSTTTNVTSFVYGDIQEGRIWVKRVCPKDVLVDPFSTPGNISKVFHRIWKSEQWVKDNKDFKQPIRELVKSSGVPFNYKQLGTEKIEFNPNLVELFEVHDYESNRISVITKDGSDFLLDPYENPYDFKGSHFIFFIPYPLNDDFYGRCPTHMMEPQCDEINKFRTRMITITKRFPFIMIGEKNAFSKEQRKEWEQSEDGQYMEANDPKGITVHTASPNLAQFFNLSELMERDIEKQVGTSAMRRGEVSNIKPTTAQIITGHENVRDMFIRQTLADFYSELYSKMGDLMIQFYDTKRWMRLAGDHPLNKDNPDAPFKMYSSEDIRGNYDFEIDVNSMVPVNNETKAQVLLNTTKTLLSGGPMEPLAQSVMQKFDFTSVVSDIYRMQGLDLIKYEKKTEDQDQADPLAENEHVIKGGVLEHPKEGEPHGYHAMIHAAGIRAMGANPDDPTPHPDPRVNELKRHYQVTKAMEAKTTGGAGMEQTPSTPSMNGSLQTGGQVASMPSRPVSPMDIMNQIRPQVVRKPMGAI